MVWRNVSGLEMDLGSTMIVAGDEAVEDFGEEAPLLGAEPSHDAEINRDELAVVIDEQVAGMHVGMEEAVAHGVAEKGLDHRTPEMAQVVTFGRQRCPVAERRGVDPG